LYALLGGFQTGCSFGSLKRSKWSELDGLNTEGLHHVFRYYDAQTNDALLTKAILSSAIQLGTTVAMPAHFEHAQLHKTGVAVSYIENGQSQSAHGKALINATGPWVNHTLQRITPTQTPPKIDLIQGTHLILPGEITQGIYYVESPRDGRAIFVMPWQGHTMIGTTETRYRGDPAAVRPLQTEINYLLQTLKLYFPDYKNYTTQDITQSFAGLRVLPAGSEHAFRRPRETVFTLDQSHHPRLLSIFGGKLTGWRTTAEKVMQRIESSLPTRRAVADTRQLKLKLE
jgi:glycerol-3-phosphate dehydrogenase